MKRLPKLIAGMAASSLILLMLMAGCNRTTQTPASSTTVPTFAPTVTATMVPASLLLIDSTGAATQNLQDSLQGFATDNGLTYQTSSEANSDLSGVKIVVEIQGSGSHTTLPKDHPEIQFLFIGEDEIAPGGNLSVIHNKPEDLAFMAGYLATLVAEDWRSGGLLSSNSATIDVIADAFFNGGEYVCGTCYPLYPPFLSSPVYEDISGKTSAADMVISVDALKQEMVDTVFIDTRADLSEVLTTVETAGMFVIGDNPASSEHARYAAIIGYSYQAALVEMLPKLLAGQGGLKSIGKIALVQVNDTEKVTPGRQDLFNQTAEALAGGWIIPLSVP